MSDPERDWLFDGDGEADADDAAIARALAPLRYRAPAFDRLDRLDRMNQAKKRRRARFAAIGLPLAAAAAVVLWLLFRGAGTGAPDTSDALAVVTVAGEPRVDARAVKTHAALPVGSWVETDARSRAAVEIRDVGRVDVAPDSRLRLVSATPREQRLELARGRIDARVLAPPRLFVVDTPSAVATDLGCAYRLEVAPDGASTLRVASGAVELAGAGREAWVPQGARCETRPGRGPGCPYYEDASDALKSALRRFDFGGEAAALPEILEAARQRDALTLWHLQQRTDGRARDEVLARLRELAPAPITNW